MKIRQTLGHLAAKTALETPLVRDKVQAKLTELHPRVFLERAEPGYGDDLYVEDGEGQLRKGQARV